MCHVMPPVPGIQAEIPVQPLFTELRMHKYASEIDITHLAQEQNPPGMQGR